jgi:hypothetical protein
MDRIPVVLRIPVDRRAEFVLAVTVEVKVADRPYGDALAALKLRVPMAQGIDSDGGVDGRLVADIATGIQELVAKAMIWPTPSGEKVGV